MLSVGIVGWRGMVGSVLVDRMKAERDFSTFEPLFFTTSNVGAPLPKELLGLGSPLEYLLDAYSLEELSQCDAIITCQGADYTQDIYYKLRQSGWNGHWIDAASALRMSDESVLILDPVNRSVIDAALTRGNKTWVGSNCTVGLMLIAINGLIQNDWVEWVSTMTYQSASGAGAAQVK
ncbi:MAG: aspartate-semialdehyde dehydrogenase, partial [Gammaproteobacteria bacterium]|nr:aspartate-semialdehyde dehydrogenase [Gammaproteobacteria bacterium]